MERESYKQLLSSLGLPSVSLGYATVKIFATDELEEAQIGYSVDPSGNSLIDENVEGRWKKEWLVLGYEGLCGDPIFIDTASEGCPVYTAIHGEGYWRPKRIATNLTSFAQTMKEVATIARGRETVKDLERNPIGAVEKAHFLARIQKKNPDIDLEFWMLLLGE
jgi:hypothetical protein